MNKHIIYFGHPGVSNASRNKKKTYNPEPSRLRLQKQIHEVNLFDTVSYYTLPVLESIPGWTHSKFCNDNPRGFGHWIWKPFIINHKLSTVPEGDVVMYCDLGCELLVQERDILHNLLCSDKHDIILSFPGGVRVDTGWIPPRERDWNKAFTIHHLGASVEHLKSRQYQGTCVIIKNNLKTRQFVERWLKICEDYRTIDDRPHGFKEISDFKEHRHDQSVLSLLLKQSDLRISTDVGKGVVMCRNPDEKPRGRCC